MTSAIIEALKNFPDDLVKTITFDRGKEFGLCVKSGEEVTESVTSFLSNVILKTKMKKYSFS